MIALLSIHFIFIHTLCASTDAPSWTEDQTLEIKKIIASIHTQSNTPFEKVSAAVKSQLSIQPLVVDSLLEFEGKLFALESEGISLLLFMALFSDSENEFPTLDRTIFEHMVVCLRQRLANSTQQINFHDLLIAGVVDFLREHFSLVAASSSYRHVYNRVYQFSDWSVTILGLLLLVAAFIFGGVAVVSVVTRQRPAAPQ